KHAPHTERDGRKRGGPLPGVRSPQTHTLPSAFLGRAPNIARTISKDRNVEQTSKEAICPSLAYKPPPRRKGKFTRTLYMLDGNVCIVPRIAPRSPNPTRPIERGVPWRHVVDHPSARMVHDAPAELLGLEAEVEAVHRSIVMIQGGVKVKQTKNRAAPC